MKEYATFQSQYIFHNEATANIFTFSINYKVCFLFFPFLFSLSILIKNFKKYSIIVYSMFISLCFSHSHVFSLYSHLC